jgi:hypothetical protein
VGGGNGLTATWKSCLFEKVVSAEITVLALILAQMQGINAELNINLDMAYIKYPSKLEQKVVPFKSISVGVRREKWADLEYSVVFYEMLACDNLNSFKSFKKNHSSFM